MTDEEIEKLAALSRLSFTKEDMDSFRGDLTSILSYVGEISRISEGAPEIKKLAPTNVMREDVNAHEPGKYTDALLGEAPQREGNFIKVKKILP